ncbi:MAG: YkvA family protein [Gemmatimonadota bacterium]|nr:YkvA family protein [Gemmatimonadota bacterium]
MKEPDRVEPGPVESEPSEPRPVPVESRSRAKEVLRELALFLPNFVLLLKRLMGDSRVPSKSKVVLGGTLLYLVSPIDVIPDFVPGLGQLDDVVLAVLALHSILNRVDEEIVLEHWDGDEALILLVRQGVSAVSRLLPGDWNQRV